MVAMSYLFFRHFGLTSVLALTRVHELKVCLVSLIRRYLTRSFIAGKIARNLF